jgi:aconitate hydratase
MQPATLTTSCGLSIPLVVRLDTPAEIDYYLAGGILPFVLNQILDTNK